MSNYMYSTNTPNELHRMLVIAVYSTLPKLTAMSGFIISYIDTGNADRTAKQLSLEFPNGQVTLADDVVLRAIYRNGERVETRPAWGWDDMDKHDRALAGIPCCETGQPF